MGAYNFNFVPKFPKLGAKAQILHFWTKIFQQEYPDNFPAAQNFHDATGNQNNKMNTSFR